MNGYAVRHSSGRQDGGPARNREDVIRAKITVARQLQRKDIGRSHQRAYLQGLLSALEWAEGFSNGNALTLQMLMEGREIRVDNGSQISGPTSQRALGAAGVNDLMRQYTEETGCLGGAWSQEYVAWLEGKLTGVGLVLTS